MPTLQKINLLKFPLISAIFLCGCSANHYSIHQSELLDSDKSTVISVDAKQRFLLSNVITKTTAEIPAIEGKPAIPAADGKPAIPAADGKPAIPATEGKPAIPATEGKPSQPKTTEKFRRYCTEPSPDVFTVLSQSASAGGSFGQTADPKSINIALQGAFSSNESGSTISRTQTINMLKEMMYRTCESYLNGQISDDEYPIIAARDQRIMTSILAIEQLTGAALPKPVVIATTSSTSTGQTTSDAILALDNADKEVVKKKEALKTAQVAFDGVDNPSGTCKNLLAKDKKDVATADMPNWTQCDSKKTDLDNADKELKHAQELYNLYANLAGKPGVSSATTNAQLLTTTSGATETDLNIEKDRTQRITAVAEAVKEIVSSSFRLDDETAFFCYRVLGKKFDSSLLNPEAVTICNEFFKARAYEQSQLVIQRTESDIAKAVNETARLSHETDKTIKQMDGLRKSSFDKFWDKIKDSSGNLDQAKLKTLVDSKFPSKASKPLQVKLDALKNSTTKDGVSKIFNSLPLWANDQLIKD